MIGPVPQPSNGLESWGRAALGELRASERVHLCICMNTARAELRESLGWAHPYSQTTKTPAMERWEEMATEQVRSVRKDIEILFEYRWVW